MDRLRARQLRALPKAPARVLAALALLAAPVLSGCAAGGPGSHPAAIDTPRALIDSYLIAHGMALGYGRSGRAGPAEIARLIQYDRAAMIAVATATFQPGPARTKQAQTAVGAMLRYTGDQDLSGIAAADAQ